MIQPGGAVLASLRHVVGIFLMLASNAALAGNDDYTQIGESVVSSFECTTLAAHARYNQEEIRLMAYGLANGKLLVEAHRAGRISKDDMNRSDLILSMVLRVWSFQKLDTPVDFAVGSIYEAICSRTTGDLGARTRKLKDPQHDYSLWAQADFKEKNCRFLGK